MVLPDHADALTAARRCSAVRIVRHASGRPWLIGRWADDDITIGAAGSTRIAVLGCCPVSAETLTSFAERLRDLAGLDHLVRRLPGSFHLIATLDGRCRVQGTASGLRRVFHARVGGLAVAADRADLLADATGAEPDEEQLAVRLLWPVPHPLLETTLWTEVTSVPPGSALLVDADGRHTRVSRWWTPPEPVRSIARSAGRVREALSTAVDARCHQGGVVSCDFSGGLDSTSVCFLAAASNARVVASTWPGRDPGDDDLHWAERATEHLPQVDHVVWPAEESPLVYTNLLDIDVPLDEPTIGVMDRARALKHLPGLKERGSRLHLTGIGGDHVTWCSEAYYHRLLRVRPVFALRQLRGFRALWNWPLRDMARALADRRSFRRWLADSAAELRDPPPPTVSASLGWGMPSRVFDWMTPHAVRTVQRVLRQAAENAEPLHDDRGMHVDLDQIRMCTRIVRHWDLMAARAGLPMASPFFDDRVLEACLAVDPGERVTPWRYKPLLTTAMRGVVPDDCLRRTNKAQAAMDAADGLRRHRGDLLALWESSRLAELGLVDAAKLRELAHRPDTPALREAILYSTIACEVWLRKRTKIQL
ncbi:lasso peptide isopeptide bond-forming cyclase [Saccharopolyspora taberi]|uniref:asparagine synthase (glutamine-hydrolyzing) n=1 Tax=Saccharopolyspora taberi TaxID=60895 RepID=A0ABN3VHD9_9PSEU